MKSPASTKMKSNEDRGVIVIEEKFEVITPIFGGGVYIDQNQSHLKEPDPITPVRAASVRGQLRFWWRATQAHRFPTLDELREEEARLWGSVDAPAQVALQVNGSSANSPETLQVFDLRRSQRGRLNVYELKEKHGLAYGAFPLRPEQSKLRSEGVAAGVLHPTSGEYTLRLTLPSAAEAQVREAVTAWLLFGGVGGRTRRGFGAVVAKGRDLDPEAFLKQFRSETRVHAGVSSLVGARLQIGGRRFKTGEAALNSALSVLRDFRQKPGFARNRGEEDARRPGRSRWPEPEAIRAHTGYRLRRHQEQPRMPHAFPRAEFGMPIVFHFKDHDARRPRHDKSHDPPDAHLLPVGAERRASPLIVRPVRIKGNFHPLALVLQDPARHDEPLRLRWAGGEPTVLGALTPSEAHEVTPLKGNPDPLSEFLNYFESKLSR